MNDSEENPYRRLEPHVLQINEQIYLDGPGLLRFERHEGKIRLRFSACESTDVIVKKPDGTSRKLRTFP